MANENYLVHYGVKGMKWGVRRAEKRAHKKLVKASNAYFRERAHRSGGMTSYASAANRNAERNLASARRILDQAGSTRTDGLFGMAQTQNGREWWEQNGYELL